MWPTPREFDIQSKGSEVNPRRRVGRMAVLAERCRDLEDSIRKPGGPAGAQAQDDPLSQTLLSLIPPIPRGQYRPFHIGLPEK